MHARIPHLLALLKPGTFREFYPYSYHPQPKGRLPSKCGKHPPALAQEDPRFALKKPVWKQQQIESVLGERTSVKSCVRGGFQEKSCLTPPGTSSCYTETEFQLGLFGGVWFSAPDEHTS